MIKDIITQKILKRNFRIRFLSISKYGVIILFFFFSCSEWLDINTDPDVPQDLSYQEFLPAGISSVAYVLGGKYQVLGALWSQHWTQSPGASQYTGIDSYDINSSTFDDNQFGELYSGALQNLEYVRSGAESAEAWDYYLIATVMQAYTFQVLADLYDEIPFSEALQGADGNTQPIYESGQNVYDSLIVRLDYALAKDLGDELSDNIEEKDILFNGDIDMWIQFANTLKLRLYLRQTEIRPAVAQAGIQSLYDEKAEFLNDDAVLDLYTDESGQRNPLYSTEMIALSGNPNLILSYTLYSYFIDNDDLYRLDYLFYSPDDGGSHKALAQGNYYAPEEDAGINSSSYSKPVMLATDPVYLMSYAESCFLQSEAIMRYNVDDYDNARELYNSAVEDTYTRIFDRYENYVDNSINNNPEAYYEPLLSSNYSFPSEGTELEEFIKTIITQKWVSLAGIQSLETFFEQKRTLYPSESSVKADDSDYEPGEFTVSVNNVTNGKFPARLIFPESEYSSNPNTPEKKEVWEKVWWNVKEN